STPLELQKRQDQLSGFKICDGNYPVTINTFTCNPNPIILGHNLALRFAGVANAAIEDGSILSFYHQSGNAELVQDFCKDYAEQSAYKCPIVGSFDLTSIVFLDSPPDEPKNVTEKLYTKIILSNPDGTNLFCIEGYAVIYHP
ncbi:4832_t:CDS:2, partial [Funneliformis geosporum]